ncbi:MAG: cytochrome c biogenesis protein CcsA [Fibrobacter sp.]|nr:cytochrome c biogenesis protein CcsA [Fibrobacter sp.]
MMQKLRPYLVKLASLKVSAFLLVAFLLLTFWGVMAQTNAEAAGISVADAADRFFGSYFIWALGWVPIPAFKTLAVLSSIHLILSMVYRMPRVRGVRGGWRNLGLYGMHVALLVLLVGSLVGSTVKQEYNGFAVMQNADENVARDATALGPAKLSQLKFFALDDSLGVNPLEITTAEWPYFVQYRGYVEMAPGKNVALYRATYDPFHAVPYVFMILFVLSAVFHYVARVRVVKGVAVASLAVLLAGMAFPVEANATVKPVPVFASTGDVVLPSQPVFYNGEFHAYDSFAREVLDELSGKVTYKSESGERIPAISVVTDIINSATDSGCATDVAAKSVPPTDSLPLFKVLRSDVLLALQMPAQKRYVSFAELQQSRGLLEIYASRDDKHPATAEMKRLLGNVLLYESVQKREAFEFKTYTDSVRDRVGNEVVYHRLNPVLWTFVLAVLGLLLASANLWAKSRKLDVGANVACLLSTLVLGFALVLRWYATSRVPLANLYEIILVVSLLLQGFLVGAFIWCKRRTFTLMVPVAFMTCLLLFFAKFVLETGNTFQTIPAVLNSSVFLTLHVFTIAVGFAAMILSGVVAHVCLWRATVARLQLLYATLAFGAGFTILGTLLGGVWADFAWGRFWGFDPKECGALFVCLWGMLALHLRAGRLVDERGFALINCFNVIVTFLCWFGVNLLGVGLHSYGFQSGTALWLGCFVMVDVIVICALHVGRGARRLPRS